MYFLLSENELQKNLNFQFISTNFSFFLQYKKISQIQLHMRKWLPLSQGSMMHATANTTKQAHACTHIHMYN